MFERVCSIQGLLTLDEVSQSHNKLGTEWVCGTHYSIQDVELASQPPENSVQSCAVLSCAGQVSAHS